MQIRSLSATSIKMFEQCPYKYKLNYSLPRSQIKTGPLALGTAVHDVLHRLVAYLSSAEKYPAAEDYKLADELFTTAAVENHLSDTNLFKEGLDIIYDFLGSFDPTVKVIDLETKFDIKIGPVSLIGAIDKVVELEPDTIGIIDYKTSYIAPTNEELGSDIQLSVYDLAASTLYPQYQKRSLALHMLRKGTKLVSYRTDTDRKFIESYVQHLYNQISKMDECDFKAIPNTYCGWCDFRNRCQSYGEYVNGTSWAVQPVAALTTDDEVINEWEKLNIAKKIINERENTLKMLMAEKVRDAGGIITDKSGKTVYAQQNTMVSYDSGAVMNTVPKKDLKDILRVDKSALKRYLEKNPEIKAKLSNDTDISYSAPSFRLSK